MTEIALFNLKAQLKMVLDEFTESTKDGMVIFNGDDDCRFACCMIQAVVKAVDRSDEIQRFLFRTGVNWPTVRDTTDTIDNLKMVLMALGNTLVTEYDYDPTPSQSATGWIQSTQPIVVFTEWLNQSDEALAVLNRLGYSWPTVDRSGESTDNED